MIAIHEATDADFDAIWEIIREVVQAGETYPFDPGMTKEDAYRVWVEAPRATFIAKANDQIVGTYYLKANQPALGAHVCNAGYMVSTRARGRGIGRAMCRHSLQAARAIGFLAMQFNLVVATNVAAIKLWQDCGFEIIGRLPEAFRHKRLGLVDAYVMYQWLGDG